MILCSFLVARMSSVIEIALWVRAMGGDWVIECDSRILGAVGLLCGAIGGVEGVETFTAAPESIGRH